MTIYEAFGMQSTGAAKPNEHLTHKEVMLDVDVDLGI